VERFLADGGGVLVVLGERMEAEAAFYNEALYRGGSGWLPARLERVAGDRNWPDRGAAPDVKSFQHPSLELFREEPNCTLGQVQLPRWWQVTTAGRNQALTGALLTTGDPLFVEQSYKKGRVLLCTVPMDRSWGASLPSVWEFPVLAHELVYYLADVRSVDHNLQAGQPLRYWPATNGKGAAHLNSKGSDHFPSEALKLYPPEGGAIPIQVEHWPLVYENARDTGIYRLEDTQGERVYFVVQPDPRESDLTPTTEDDRKKVSALVRMEYETQHQPVTRALVSASQTQELWGWLMAGVLLLLCAEVWMTRRMALRRSSE
jgi:hypothetical protein